ncbi:pilin [Patescibacteria group bacterium]|nr:pilin [Patescibacteria group bacterium]
MKFKFFIFIFGLAVLGFVFFASPVSALDTGVNAVNNSIELSQEDPRTVVGRIINIAILFLGVIAVGIIIIAGFKWMMAGGDEEKINSAKKLLKNGVIGLVIVLSSWGIATFILNRLLGATDNGGINMGTDDGNSGIIGSGAIGSCSVQSVYPEPSQKDVARNTAILIEFKEELNLETFCLDTNGDGDYCNSGDKINPENIHIYEQNNGDACDDGDCNNNITDVYATVSDNGLSFALAPANHLGSSDSKTWHTVYLSNAIEKADQGNIFDNCSTDYLEWSFEVGTFLDLTPPQVTSVFPAPDNGKDSVSSTSYQAATGSITVLGELDTYTSASVDSVVKNDEGEGANWDEASAEISEDYHQQIEIFTVQVTNGGSQAALYDNNSNLVAQGVFNNNEVVFDNYFTLTVSGDTYSDGSSWLVNVTPEVLADSLTVGSQTYVVSEDEGANKIELSSDVNEQAQNIYITLSGHPNVEASHDGDTINLEAKVQGEEGNNIILNSSATNLDITSMSGGVTGQEIQNTDDKKDQPRNSIIQINFNEAINPATISGSASNISNFLRIINFKNGASNSGNTCVDDSDCLSYNCNENICEGDYLDGNFVVSNQFKTVEFISNNECGVNGCGETIYCLPGSSNLAVVLVASDLKSCASDNDCVSHSPFNNCEDTGLDDNVCQDDEGSNYPASDPGDGLTGILDAALNSLDGNSDGVADGPLSFYYENIETSEGKDNYMWSFYINDNIEISAPKINTISPELDDEGVNLDDPVVVEFDKLMSSTSLKSGSTIIKQGDKEYEHQLINLRGSSPYGLGYWINTENTDIAPLDGQADVTSAIIKHSLFSDALTHIAEVGSGVRDIYQNCYKPSSGPDCVASDLNPSCCSGVASENCDNN